jgi:hypothetical protein
MSKKVNYFAKMYSGIFGQQVTLEPRGRKIIMTFPQKQNRACRIPGNSLVLPVHPFVQARTSP